MDHDPAEIDWERLDRCLSGRGTPEELEALERWVRAHPLATQHGLDESAAWRRMRERMDQPPVRALHLSPSPRRHPVVRPRSAWLYPSLAALVAAAAIATVWIQAASRQRRVPRGESRATRSALAMRVVATGRKQQASVELSDGSRVVLAPDSRLRIPAAYGARSAAGSTRDLYLDGKAYFTVRHDTLRPLLIHTATAVAQDIGTEFVVAAYPEMRATEIYVTHGSVALLRPDATAGADSSMTQPAPARRPLAVITEGMLARIDSFGTTLVKQRVQAMPYIGWTRGVLAFDATPLREAVVELSRWYDADIRVADAAVGTTRVTAELSDEPLDEAVRRLTAVLGVRAKRHGRVVIFESRAGVGKPEGL